MSCKHDCEKPVEFPKTIDNRPGLPRIDYRIGTYAELRDRMLALLNQAPTLAGWTHRGADDPGIALLESTAVVGDILTFYQQLYANEQYLRTAQWRESVAELVRLLGYRLAPGVAGEAVFALAVKGAEPVTVPKGFGLKATLEASGKVELESREALVAYPRLSQFQLYRPRQSAGNITAGGNRLELQAVGGATDSDSLASAGVKPGDRIMLVPDATMWDVTGTAYSAQKKAEIVVVDSVEAVLDRVVLTFKGALIENRGATVTAYRLGRSFRHFGHNAPAFTTSFDNGTHNVTLTATDFVRDVWSTHSPASPGANYYTALAENEMPLDQQVNDLAAGGKLVCQAFVTFDGQSTAVPLAVVKDVKEVRADSVTWGNLNAGCTMAIVDSKLVANDSISTEVADIRRMQFHEALGAPLTLRAPTTWITGAFADTALGFPGTYDDVKALAGRALLLAHDNGTFQTVKVADSAESFSLSGKDATHSWMWTVHLDQVPAYAREDFDEEAPRITVYGNLLDATQGKTQDEVVLGNGDRRQTFQTFALPKAPLTYLFDETQTPAQTPELTVYVDGIAWARVDTFFNAGCEDAVYVVREDEDGKSYVQFGDGKNGRRLPSGLNNVTAVYRMGSGAYGPLKDGSHPQLTGKLRNFDKLYLPQAVAVGNGPEDASSARVAAPGKMQSLGRMVSLADIEAEALVLPHVLKAGAVWAAPEGVPLVRLTVLTQSGEVADVDAVRDSMQTYNHARGPARYPIDVIQGIRQYVYVRLEAGYAADRREQDVTAAIKQALGLAGEVGNGVDGTNGLFGLAQRRFGENVHTSQIIAAAQNTEGVAWVRLKAAQILDLGTPPETDPTALAKPSIDVISPVLSCTAERLLALHSAHLTLSLSKNEEPTA